MRILISGTTGDSMPPPYAGVQNVSLLYAKTYRKMGHEVAVTFVFRPENSDDLGAKADYFFEYKSKPNKIKKALFLFKYFLKNPLLYVKLFREYFSICPRLTAEIVLYSAYGVFMEEVIKKWKPDIIACQTALIKTFMISIVAKKLGIPLVYEPYAEIHDLNMGVNKHLNEEQRKKYWSSFLKMSDLVIGMDNCSVGAQAYLPLEKVKVFYDTCDFEFYQKKLNESKEELRKSFNLPINKFLVVMTGAFHYRKGHDQLIKAIAMLKKRGLAGIGAVIVGGDVGMEKWIDLAKEEDITENIYFLQNLSEEKKLRLYTSMDGYCNLSNSTRSCGLDLALLEAMSCALPIIVYDNGALPNAVSENNGYVVSTGDASSVADAVLDLYKKTDSERKEMAEGSRKFASKTDLNVTAGIKINWFKEILSKK
ncbi:MAG: glycosyl transferase group 1 [Parcubacteria bacterium C7867-003]|nr:MAG: glycosyl transferase group 1 [Parcubacteria bacterium C7867-003]